MVGRSVIYDHSFELTTNLREYAFDCLDHESFAVVPRNDTTFECRVRHDSTYTPCTNRTWLHQMASSSYQHPSQYFNPAAKQGRSEIQEFERADGQKHCRATVGFPDGIGSRRDDNTVRGKTTEKAVIMGAFGVWNYYGGSKELQYE